MKNKTESMFFIAISPIGPLQKRIDSVKTAIHQKYDANGSFRSPPHITLQMPFKKKLSKINSLKSDLLEFCQLHTPFYIKLNGFGCFEPRVIYIKVIETEALIKIQHELEKLLKQHQIFGSNYKGQAFHPHITVAFRGLRKQQFSAIWNEYQYEPFEEQFITKGLTLYEFKDEKWEIVEFFPFNNH